MSSQTSQPELIDFYGAACSVWQSTYLAAKAIREEAPRHSLEDLADQALVLKKVLERVEDARAEINKALDVMSQIACLRWTARGDGKPIHGELCTATPNTGVAPPSFKRRDDPEKYDALMRYLGFSEQAIETEIARPHWPSMQQLLSRLGAEGRPLPECLEGVELRNTYSLTCRCRSGVDLDELVHERRVSV